MVKIVALLNLKPDVDPEEFERQYYQVHIPMVKKLPGLKKYLIGKVRPSKRHQVPFYRVAELYFDDMDALRQAISSPENTDQLNDQPFYEMLEPLVEFISFEEELPL